LHRKRWQKWEDAKGERTRKKRRGSDGGGGQE